MPIPVPFLVGMVELSGVECAGELEYAQQVPFNDASIKCHIMMI